MSESGFPPPSYPPPSWEPVDPAPESPSEIPLWVIVVAVLLLVVGSGVVAAVLLIGGEDKEEKSYPKAWDPRVAPYVQIVEKKRGLNFMHPVPVRFLSQKDFEKTVTADKDDLDKEEREELEQYTGLFRALGLLTGDVDLFDAFNDVHSSGTLAYYSPEEEEVVVRGTKISLAGRATLVHELTHVLQDQHFAIGDRLDKLAKANEKKATTEYDVFDAIVEGDAERIATEYKESLPAKQRKALNASEAKEREGVREDYAKVPKVVLTMVSSPYTLGEAMVQAAAADGGNHAVDELFQDPPAHDAVLLDPLPALAGDDKTAKVDVPELADGEKKFVSGEFGALSFYFMLAERMPVIDALTAADAWDGDGFVAFERDGTSCARVAFQGDDEQDTNRMLSALRRWVAAAPGSPAKVSRDGVRVRFESCDPGKKTKVGRQASVDALTLLTIRSQLGAVLVKQGAPAEASRCIADKSVREFPMSTLTSDKLNAADTAKLRQIALSCAAAAR